MVFWAGNFIVVKGAIGILPPIGFTFLRYCVAAVTLLVLLRWREGAIRLPHGDIIRIGLLGIVGFGCYQILWPVALQSIPAGDSALLIAATPVITARPRDVDRGRYAQPGQARRARSCRSPAWRSWWRPARASTCGPRSSATS